MDVDAATDQTDLNRAISEFQRAIGSTLAANNVTVSTGGSFGAASLQQEVGLGPAARIDELRITWPNPDRTVEVFPDLAVNRHYKVVEGAGRVETVQRPVVPFRKEKPRDTLPPPGGYPASAPVR